jgi:DNA-binding transcriptional LysR family regulator
MKYDFSKKKRIGMNQKQIDAFRVVMMRGSMTAAADELGTSQPSVSRLIAELEASTGLQLFTRAGGRIQATAAGTAFYREVDRSFVGLHKLALSAREIQQFGSGRLRLVAAPVLALSLMPQLIEQFLATYPGIAISLEMRSNHTIQRWASSAYCDIGLATGAPDSFGVASTALYELAGLCAIPAGHALAAKEKITASDLKDEALVLPTYADATRSSLDRILQEAGVHQAPAIETPYGATICAMVSRGLGIGIVNPLATMNLRSDRVVFRPFAPEILYRGFALRPQLHQANPLVDAFLELTDKTFKSGSGFF